MAYKAPIWEDGKSPAISAENLNNLSQAAEGAQVLYGNSAPTSSTEGAVGQFYLVVVADSDGNYPLYQCVAIANGSYTWRDTRRIPDSITSMLGIPAPGTINRALNVLAHVGNLHVWERVKTYAEPVPEVLAGYTLGEVETNVHISSLTSGNVGIRYGDSVTVSNDGTVSISNSSDANNSVSDWGYSAQYGKLNGKFCTVYYESGSYVTKEVFFYPSGAYLRSDSNGLYATKLQPVTGYPYTPAIPAGTTTDYLTSTDRNAYPDQSAEGGQDAYYTLGDVVSGKFELVSDNIANIAYYKAGTGVTVSENGALTLTGATSVKIQSSEWSTIAAQLELLRGKYCSIINYEGGAPVFANFDVFYIPEDVVFTIPTKSNQVQASVSKYQPVTGHAATPANTTITYLGQLGGGARIEVGSYVGTGTYGSSNPCSVSASFPIKQLSVFGKVYADTGNYFPIYQDSNRSSYSMHDILLTISFASRRGIYKGTSSYGLDNSFGKKSADGKTFSWYSLGTDASFQLNESANIYYYIAIG